MNQTESTPARPAANTLRQLASAFYDGLLLIAVLFLASALTVPLTTRGIIAIDSPLISLYLFAICFLFFGWFWTHGGQTLGMRAWRVKVVRADGAPLSWGDALKRHLAALLSCLPLGLGFLWAAVDPEGLAWHDRLSGTRLTLTEKTAN